MVLGMKVPIWRTYLLRFPVLAAAIMETAATARVTDERSLFPSTPFLQPCKFICTTSVMPKYSKKSWMILLYEHAFLRDEMLVFEKLTSVHCSLSSSPNSSPNRPHNVRVRLLPTTLALTGTELQPLLLCQDFLFCLISLQRDKFP